MSWKISFILAATVFVATLVTSFVLSKSKKNKKYVSSLNILLCGVFISSVIMFFPIYMLTFKSEHCGLLKTFLLSVHNTIRLFIVDGEFNIVTDSWKGRSGVTYTLYSVLASILFVLAPILTFGVVLSFFKNLSAQINLVRSRRKDLYIFSEMNEKSLSLAKSIMDNKDGSKKKIVFTDFFETDDEATFEMKERADALGAICFRNDILSLRLKKQKPKSKISFFVIGEDESENIAQTLKLFSSFSERENTYLYAFSKRAESEMILQRNDSKKLKFRRVNDTQSLIYNNLYKNGFKIFDNAADIPDEKNKQLSAAIIGLGSHGTEMLKALSWFCQMDGYDARITAFEKKSDAESRMKAQCPELLDDSHNGNFSDNGEAKYSIKIHSGIDAGGYEFSELFKALKTVTYVFVSLGDDELNVKTAAYVRMLCERMGQKPFIQTIVYDENKKTALNGAENFSGQPYNVDFIGDLNSLYSVDIVLDSEIEALALKRHLKWGEEEDFWRFDYNRRSSVASAIHSSMKVACGIPGAQLAPDDRDEKDRIALRILEHRRWNAYMRSEGYIYSGSIEKSTRNNLGKMHHCLVPFDELPVSEQEKDDD